MNNTAFPNTPLLRAYPSFSGKRKDQAGKKMSWDLSCTRTDTSTCLLYQGLAAALLLHCISLVQGTGYGYLAFYHQFMPDTSVLYEDVIVCFAWLNAALILQQISFTGLQLSHFLFFTTPFLS